MIVLLRKEVFMNIYDKIKKISETNDKVLMFVDMDGTIAEYNFFTKEYQEENKDGLFINTRPLTSVLDCLNKISKINNIELYILSICMYEHDKKEKLDWLNKYTPFIKKNNRVILTQENNDYTPQNKFEVKAEYMNNLATNNEHIIFLEDTHENMRKSKELLGDRITNIHISSFVD